MKKEPQVFDYLDYRKYLADYYTHRKGVMRAFSYRWFARRAGLMAPNHLKRVIDGERNLKDDTALKYAEALGLEGDASDYFCELVRFCQANTSKERSVAYRRLTRFRGYQRAQHLDAQHDRYHSEWFIPAIREMIGRPDFRLNPKWLAKQLMPPITEGEAKEAVQVLEDLGMIHIDEQGRVTRADEIVSTGPETTRVHVSHYHGVMMKKAMESIDLVPAKERDLSGVTLRVAASSIPDLKKRIADFRKEVIAMEADEGEGDRVVHIAVQLFPLTTDRQDNGSER